MYKTRRQNHDFQIAYFLAGKCHTPDGAYGLLCDLRDDRQAAIAAYHVETKRLQARELRARNPSIQDEAAGLEACADLEEIGHLLLQREDLFASATAELAFIERCVALVQPLRAFGHLPDIEAHEAAQRAEWLGELLHRAENYIASQGTIPHDELAIMRSHPDFAETILPHVEKLAAGRGTGQLDQILKTKPRLFDPERLFLGAGHRRAITAEPSATTH